MHRVLLIALFLGCALLALVHLDATSFWDDESGVGIVARNFLHTGTLTGWDGRNLYAYRNGTLLTPDLRYINPPLDCLIAAASFKVFGISVWSARLPFVLFGLAALVAYVFVLRHDFPENPTLWCYSTASLAFSVVFLLNIRTCRYYAPALFFTLLAYLCYRRCLRGGRLPDFVGLALSLALLFYSNYLLCFVFIFGLGVRHLSQHRDEIVPQAAKQWGGAALLFLMLTLPFAVTQKVWARQDVATNEPWLPARIVLLWWNLRDVNMMSSLPWVLCLVLIGAWVWGRRRGAPDPILKTAQEWAVLVLGYLFFMALLSPQWVTNATISDIRYLTPLLPFFAGLVGMALFLVHRRLPLAGVLLFGLTVGTNVLTLTPSEAMFPDTTEFRWLLPAYVGEITHPYPTANGEVAEYLRTHAHQNDLVNALPDHLEYPLVFAMGDKITECCTLNHRTPLPADTVRRLHAPLYREENFPDWLVCFGATGEAEKAYYSRPHRTATGIQTFRYRPAATLNVYWNQTQRPELPWHSFGPATDFDRSSQGVTIYERIR